MDYATCVRKVENTMHQLAGVNQVQILFTTEKLVIGADSDIRVQAESVVQKAGYSLRDGQAADKLQASRLRGNLPLITLIVMMVVSWGLEQFNHPFGQLAFIAATLVGPCLIVRQTLRLIKSGSYFAIETLVSVAATDALFIGAMAEVAVVLLLFSIDERLEGWVVGRVRQGASVLVVLKPEAGIRLRNGEWEEVAINSLRPGDVIEVAAGEHLPVDGKPPSSFASLDKNALTGGSIPMECAAGDRVSVEVISVDRLVMLEVLSESDASAIDRILKLVEEAEEHRVPIEWLTDHFSRIYTPTIMAVALLVTLVSSLLFAANWQEWIYKGLTLLLIGCPCALVVPTPAATTSGLVAVARRGVLIKGGAALGQLGRVTQMALDRTGTLTVGKPRVIAIHPATDISGSELLTLAAVAEQGVTHLLAQAIVRETQVAELVIPTAESQQMLVGSGIEAQVNGERVSICAAGKRLVDAFTGLINELESTGQTVVLVVRNDGMLGIIALQDILHVNAATAISEPNTLEIKGVILAGDSPRAATTVAGELGLEFKAGLLPEDKVKAMTELNQHTLLAMVGDGINDTLTMKAATIGIAMGNGTDVALEIADAALTHNHLRGLVQMIRLVRATHASIRQDTTITLGPRGIFLVTTLLGMTGLWLAVLVDAGVIVLITTNALRLLCRR